VKEQFKPRILETFDPVTQKLYRHLPVTIYTEIHTKIKALEQAELLFLSIARELGTVAQSREHNQTDAHYPRRENKR
jgi:hypothetical protein